VSQPEDTSTNRHLFWKVEQADKAPLVAAVVEREWPAIVFTRTKHRADRLTKQLSKAGLSVQAIHGDRSQAQRERALAAFTAGKLQALVATDVAARGIHVDGVRCVVHLDPPATGKDYVHRSGRTGRAGAPGTVISIVCDDQRAAVHSLRRTLGLADAGPRPATKARPRPSGSTRRRSKRRPEGSGPRSDTFRE
jgi:superfamily II DNA/RNA helicase